MKITVFPHTNIKAYNGTNPRGRVRGETMPLSLALQEQYDTDAHMVCYHLPGRSSLPRHSKASLRAYESGDGGPIFEVFALDVDLPGHASWASLPDSGRSFLAELSQALKAQPELWDGCGVYPTAHGLRLLVQPQAPIPATHADSFLRQLLDAANVPGLDKSCCDWTRMFRMPRVLREGAPEPPSFVPCRVPSSKMAWTPAALYRGAVPASGFHLSGEAPPLPEKAKPPTLSSLKGVSPALTSILNQGMPLETRPGMRHAAIVNAAVEVAKATEARSPDQVFRTLQASILAMRADRDLWTEAYKVCQWAVSCALGQAEEEAREDAETEAEVNALLRRLAERLGTDESVASRCLLVHCARAIWVLDPTTLEYQGPYTTDTAPIGIRDYLGDLIDPSQSLANLLRGYGTVAHQLIYNYEGHNHLDLEASRLSVCLSRPIKPEPRFDQGVQDFLELWGPKVVDWCASFWREKPCAALYLHAAKETGKSLIASLLADAAGGFCEFDKVSDDFNDALRFSRLIWGDESVEFPRGKSPATHLRRMLGSKTRPVRVKYQDDATSEGWLRIVFSGNNETLVRFRDALTPEDAEALSVRVVYVRPGEEAEQKIAAHLRKLREDYARAKGFAPDSPDAPNFIEEVWRDQHVFLAHCVWLEKNHTFQTGRRFVVEGTHDNPWAKALLLRHGFQHALVSVIARALSNEVQGRPAVIRQDGYVYVNAPALEDVWEVFSREKMPSGGRITAGLRTLSSGDRQRKRLDSRLGNVHYWVIPEKLVIEEARELGINLEQDEEGDNG